MARDWDRIAEESATWVMRPLSSRGLWAKQQPFGDPIPNRWDGPIAAITRGRIKPRMWRTFWSAVPPVVLDVKQGGGLTFAMGIGEAPVGLQGTFSTWSDGARPVGLRPPPPRAPAGHRQTEQLGWYSEELFARFALLSAEGTVAGQPVPAPDAGSPRLGSARPVDDWLPQREPVASSRHGGRGSIMPVMAADYLDRTDHHAPPARTVRRVCTRPRIEGVPATTSPTLRVLPWVLGGAGVLSQIVWVLLPEDLRDAATITSVLLLAAAGACHAAVHRGPGWAACLYGATAAIGLAVEAIGTATGFPFGAYRYGTRLGPMVLDVPLLIPLAWCMAAYPMLLLAQRLGTRRWQVMLIGAWTITAWDLFLDPQMVGEGHWAFADPTPRPARLPRHPADELRRMVRHRTAHFLGAGPPAPDSSRRSHAAPAHALDLRLQRDGRRRVLRPSRGRGLGRDRHGDHGDPLGAPGGARAATRPRPRRGRHAVRPGRAAVLAATVMAAGLTAHTAWNTRHLRPAPVLAPGDPVEQARVTVALPARTRPTG